MHKRATKAVLAGLATIAVTTGVSAAMGTYQSIDASLTSAKNVAEQQIQARTVPGPVERATTVSVPLQDAQNALKQVAAKKTVTKKIVTKKKTTAKKALPSGTSTATSFWDASTASGNPMSFKTIASPYWPLGTKVKITYQGKSAIGVVQDFGPAEWAVAQHDIPAILDLSETMMEYLSGTRSDTIHAQFQVLQFGNGSSYRTSGTGYDLAYGKSPSR